MVLQHTLSLTTLADAHQDETDFKDQLHARINHMECQTAVALKSGIPSKMLSIYKSPESEQLAFDLSIKRLIDIGYPKELRELKYKTGYVTRNVWFDKRLGNLLKTDEHCNILTAFHGFVKLEKKEIRQHYPNKHITLEESRIFVLNTVFNVPEALLLASLVDYFENHQFAYVRLPNGIGYRAKGTQQIILYSTIFEDCRKTIDWIHTRGDYKQTVLDNLSDYIALDERAEKMMQTLSQHGKKLFLLTNSPWKYTNALMSHTMGESWLQLFDVVIVNGNKPRWFLHDLAFKEIDQNSGSEKLGNHFGQFLKGEVYSGGCASEFIQRMCLTGKDILYVGDHIFGDVLKSKKTGGWRTLLIVPELQREMQIWSTQVGKFNELLALNNSLYASHTPGGSLKKETLREISRLTEEMEKEFGPMGSMLRCGWRQTHFASQLKKYADIYTSNVYNMAGYSPFHYFNSTIPLLPHEEKFVQGAFCAVSNTELSEKMATLRISTVMWHTVIDPESKTVCHMTGECPQNSHFSGDRTDTEVKVVQLFARVLCDRQVPDRESWIYRTVVRPLALYGAECWSVTKEVERRLGSMETKMLRWMGGVTTWTMYATTIFSISLMSSLLLRCFVRLAIDEGGRLFVLLERWWVVALFDAHMVEDLFVMAIVMAPLLIPVILFTCNKSANKDISQRHQAGESTFQEEVTPDPAHYELRTTDSLRDLRSKIKQPDPVVKHQKARADSDSYTDIIVVPLGKAQTAVVTHSNLTRRSLRKRDRYASTSKGEDKDMSQKKVHFIDEKSKERSGQRLNSGERSKEMSGEKTSAKESRRKYST